MTSRSYWTTQHVPRMLVTEESQSVQDRRTSEFPGFIYKNIGEGLIRGSQVIQNSCSTKKIEHRVKNYFPIAVELNRTSLESA